MDKHKIFPARFYGKFSYRFQKNFSLDVANSSPDLNDQKVCINTFNTAFDFIRDMRNHLDGASQKHSFPFFFNNVFIDLSCSNIVAAFHINAGKSFIMTQIKICFVSVIGYEYFSVLVGIHSSGINIEIRINF